MINGNAIVNGPLLSVRGLEVGFGQSGNVLPGKVLHNVGFEVARGEILGLVGESGSGKSVTCRALMGMLRRNAVIQGQMRLNGVDYDLAQQRRLAPLRGSVMSMIFQDPMSALDPLMSVRRHLALRGRRGSAAEEVLLQAGIAEPGAVLDAFAHQLSGGQCQRVAIACALCSQPRLLFADEPTTALDVTIQAEVLEQLRETSHRTGASIVFVTHDLGVVNELCDRVLVMHNGRIVEQGAVPKVLRRPTAAYTRQLISAIPRPATRGRRLLDLDQRDAAPAAPIPPVDHEAPPILRLQDVTVNYQRADGTSFSAVDRVSLSLWPGEIVGLVGESGSGKSTLAKTVVGLATPASGEVLFNGRHVGFSRAERHAIQYIFQDSMGSMDPTRRVIDQVREVLDIHRIGHPALRSALAAQTLESCSLAPELHRRKPGRLSGGQRQRAAVARALALGPRVLICDESVSALDVSVQARILDLLMDLRARGGLTILFISHDLGVIHHLCDRVAVMHKGRLVEEGATEAVWSAPREAYTRRLLAALPKLPADGFEPAGFPIAAE